MSRPSDIRTEPGGSRRGQYLALVSELHKPNLWISSLLSEWGFGWQSGVEMRPVHDEHKPPPEDNGLGDREERASGIAQGRTQGRGQPRNAQIRWPKNTHSHYTGPTSTGRRSSLHVVCPWHLIWSTLVLFFKSTFAVIRDEHVLTWEEQTPVDCLNGRDFSSLIFVPSDIVTYPWASCLRVASQ